MAKPWILRALIVLAYFSTARSFCEDVGRYLDIPVPLPNDMTIDLDIIRLDCPPNGELPDELDEVVVDGGTLTITSSTRTVIRFVNLRFTVESGAALVFDLDFTIFGPNSGYEENAKGFVIDVKEGGSVTFKGEFKGKRVRNVFSMFQNAGTMEFQGRARFEGNGNVFRDNSGVLKFRQKTIFRDNYYIALRNIDSGFVRFSTRTNFERNAWFFDGDIGCAVDNYTTKGKITFGGDAKFQGNACEGPGAIRSAGMVKFYGKAYFEGNVSGGNGGGVRNVMGSMIFKGAAQFARNEAEFGGGVSVEGGDVTFEKAVLFERNQIGELGSAFSVTYGSIFEDGVTSEGYGSLTFEKPSVVRTRNNVVDDDQFASDCEFGYVDSGSTVVGYPEDDFCVVP